MIKKIALIFIFCFIIISCGKKGDPEYKGVKNIGIENTLRNIA